MDRVIHYSREPSVENPGSHHDVIKWKHFPCCWPFVRGIHCHRWIPIRKASDAELWYFLWTNIWVHNQDAGDLRRHRAHYDVTVMHTIYGSYFHGHDGWRKLFLCLSFVWYVSQRQTLPSTQQTLWSFLSKDNCPKSICYSNLANIRKPITSTKSCKSFWHFAQIRIISLPGSVHNFKRLAQLTKLLWILTGENVWEDLAILQPPMAAVQEFDHKRR